MPQPPQDVDPLFEDLWQDLPSETIEVARECTAFTRARTVNTPAPLLRLVRLDGGLDQTRREVAGPCSVLEERRTDSAVARRLVACRPWVRGLLARLLPPRPRCPSGGFCASMAAGSTLQGHVGPSTDCTCGWSW